ncbi:MAG: PadR family transcriptional regulator [Erysipelotrichaceae bacterium]|nr:PadR family transcriptional regulator [Erysipelotrichaceae bacterium]
MDAQLKKGSLDVLVLSAISRGSNYGYRIIKDLKDFYEISESTLYPILKRLEANQLVKVKDEIHNGRNRKIYVITKLGYERMVEFLEDFKELLTVYAVIKKGVDEYE